MISRLRSGWADFSRGEKVAVVALAPFAIGTGFVVGLFATVYLLVSLPISGA